MRQAFSFYKSFDDTFEALNDSQTLILFKTIRDVQFLRVNIFDVKFEDNLLTVLWQSIKFSLEKSIKGYLDSQLNSKVKKPYFGCYYPYNGNLNPLHTPSEGVSQQCKEKEEEEEKEEVQFITYIEKYKKYAEALYKDILWLEATSRNHIKHSNNEINKKTIHKYLKLFLSHLSETQKIHHNKKEFQLHFSNWLRKQNIEYCTIKTEIPRYS